MLTDMQVAKYFLSKDTDGALFNKKLIGRNGRTFYEGNARLNKYLHIAQNLYIAKTGKKLFSDDLYAYDNGAVAPNIQENYAILLARPKDVELSEEMRDFLDRVYAALQNAELEELIEISHEDPEWIAKHTYYQKPMQRMDSMAFAEEYKQQYADMLKIMERMKL